MSFSFNPTGLLQNQTTLSKVDFVNKYGDLAFKYDKLNATGEQKNALFYFVPVILLILMIIFFSKSAQKVDENNKPIERTSSENILRILAWVSLVLLIVSTGYSGYMYFMLYLPQYNQWFSELPIDAKKQLNLINTLNAIASTSNNNNNRNIRSNNSSLFSFKF
jgi:hypothetical protein